MADVLFPADAVAGSPNYTGQMAAQTLSALVAGSTAARPFGGRSGVPAGTPSATVTASSSTWTVNPHSGFLDLEASTASGVRMYAIGAVKTGAMTAANATNQRVDSIFIRHDDPAQGDGSSTPTPTVIYTAGTAGTAGGARGAAGGPPNIPARSFELAQITVPVSGGGSPSVSLVAPFNVAAGGVTPCRTTADYPASPYVGQIIDDASLGGTQRWNGSAWRPQYDAWVGGEGYVVGSSPTANIRKIRYGGSFLYSPNAFGQFAVIFPTAFPNGLVTLMFCPGDTSGSLVSCTALPPANTTLSTGVGLAKNASGTLITSGTIRVNFLAEGW